MRGNMLFHVLLIFLFILFNHTVKVVVFTDRDVVFKNSTLHLPQTPQYEKQHLNFK